MQPYLPDSRRRHLLLLGGSTLLPRGAVAREEHSAARARLLAAIERDTRATSALSGRSELDPRVRMALGSVPRHRFVPEEWQHLAYANRPLPIGHDQTISQPFIVALMTDLAEIGPSDRVLEIGTGSGYQTAVLAELAARVYTVEILRPLAERAALLLRELGYGNVQTRIGDGYEGWPEAAPFDAIIVTAAPVEMPQPLVQQLARGGRLVAPIGPVGGNQQLLLLSKTADGRTMTRSVIDVRFVPLTREHEPAAVQPR